MPVDKHETIDWHFIHTSIHKLQTITHKETYRMLQFPFILNPRVTVKDKDVYYVTLTTILL